MVQRAWQWFGLGLTLVTVAGVIEAALRRDSDLLLIVAVLAELVLIGAALAYFVITSPRVWCWSLRVRHVPKSGPLGRVLAQIISDVHSDTAWAAMAWSSVQRSSDERTPLVVPIGLVDSRRFWPGWAFAERWVLDGVALRSEQGDGGLARTLEVSLAGSSFAVYSNKGRRFVLDEYRPVVGDRIPNISATARAEVLRADPQDHVRIGSGYPLRWVSAGVLPVVRWHDESWVALVFRDIFPIGWNLANGATESRREQARPQRTAEREFCEELMVLTLRNRSAASHRQFAFPQAEGSRRKPFESRSLSKVQADLRYRHDSMVITPMSGTFVTVNIRETDWMLQVTEDRLSGRANLRDFVPSVNPQEGGIELIQIMEFGLHHDEVLMDGEIIEGGPFLARRPVGLFRLDRLKEIARSGRWSEASRDCRELPDLDAEDFHIFLDELPIRRHRLAMTDLGQDERKYLSHWDREYADSFADDTLAATRLRRLCPVTWKTIEAAVARGYL